MSIDDSEAEAWAATLYHKLNLERGRQTDRQIEKNLGHIKRC